MHAIYVHALRICFPCHPDHAMNMSSPLAGGPLECNWRRGFDGRFPAGEWDEEGQWIRVSPLEFLLNPFLQLRSGFKSAAKSAAFGGILLVSRVFIESCFIYSAGSISQGSGVEGDLLLSLWLSAYFILTAPQTFYFRP